MKHIIRIRIIFIFLVAIVDGFAQNFSDSLRNHPEATPPLAHPAPEKTKWKEVCVEEQFDADGRLLMRVEKTFDDQNRCIKRQYIDIEGDRLGFRQAHAVEYIYNDKGLMVQQVEDRGSITWNMKYDEKERMIHTERQHKSGYVDVMNIFEYDKKGNKIRWKNMTGSSSLIAQEDYTYNEKGLMVAAVYENKEDKSTNKYLYEYDDNGNRTYEEIDLSGDGKIDEKVYCYFENNLRVYQITITSRSYIRERWKYNKVGNLIFYERDDNNDGLIDEYATFCYQCFEADKDTCKLTSLPDISDISRKVLDKLSEKLACNSDTSVYISDICSKINQFVKAQPINLKPFSNTRIIGYGYKCEEQSRSYDIYPELLALEYNGDKNKVSLFPLNPDTQEEHEHVQTAISLLQQGKLPAQNNIAYNYGINYQIETEQWFPLLSTSGKSIGVKSKNNRILGRETSQYLLFLEVDYSNKTAEFTDFYIWIFKKP